MATPSWVPYGNVRPGGRGAGAMGAGWFVGSGVGNPVMGLGCEHWAREELELMLVIASALSWVQAGLQGMAPAGR